MTSASATSSARRNVRAHIAISRAVCETLEQRRLLSTTTWPQPWQRSIADEGVAAAVQPVPVASTPSYLGEVGKSPISVNGEVPPSTRPFEVAFQVSQTVDLEIKLGSITSGLSARLLDGNGHEVGIVTTGEPLTAFLYKGSYTLRFHNPSTWQSTSFSLSISPTYGASPSAPSRVEVKALGGTGAWVIWVDNSQSELGYRVEMFDRLKQQWVKVGMAGTNQTGALIEGLEPNTSYQFRVAEIGKDGNKWRAVNSTNIGGVTTYAENTAGWYLVEGISSANLGEASWTIESDDLAIKPEYTVDWVAAPSWDAAVEKAVRGTIVVLKDDENQTPVEHKFGGQGKFAVGTVGELRNRPGNELPSSLSDDVKAIALEDSYEQIDRDYDDYYWIIETAERQRLENLEVSLSDLGDHRFATDGQTLLVGADGNGVVRVNVEAQLSDDTPLHRKHTHWQMRQDGTVLSSGNFTATSFQASAENGDGSEPIEFVAGFDDDADGELDEGEITQRINIEAVYFDKMGPQHRGSIPPSRIRRCRSTSLSQSTLRHRPRAERPLPSML